MRDRLGGEAALPSEGFVPILVITDDSDEARLSALVGGAKDVVTRPIDVVETMLRIRIRMIGIQPLFKPVTMSRAQRLELFQ